MDELSESKGGGLSNRTQIKTGSGRGAWADVGRQTLPEISLPHSPDSKPGPYICHRASFFGRPLAQRRKTMYKRLVECAAGRLPRFLSLRQPFPPLLHRRLCRINSRAVTASRFLYPPTRCFLRQPLPQPGRRFSLQ